MRDITDAQFKHILEMRRAGASLEEIQAYMAKCVSPDAYHGKGKKAKKGKRMRD